MDDPKSINRKVVLIYILIFFTVNVCISYYIISYFPLTVLTFFIQALLSSIMLIVAIIWFYLGQNRYLNDNVQLNKNLQQTLLELNQQQKDLFRDMQMARKVQQGLLAIRNPDVPGVKLASQCIQADSIGGDFFAFIDKREQFIGHDDSQVKGIIKYQDRIDSYLGITIGDVAGHGVSSALVMALSNGVMSEISKNTKSPAKVLFHANAGIRHYIESSNIKFVTAFYALINLNRKSITFAKAGHVCPILLKPNGRWQYLEAEGVFLGMFPDEEYEEKTEILESRDRIIFYTDGIIEARNQVGEMYGIERFVEHLQENLHQSIDELKLSVFEEIDRFSGGLPAFDDRTLVLVEID